MISFSTVTSAAYSPAAWGRQKELREENVQVRNQGEGDERAPGSERSAVGPSSQPGGRGAGSAPQQVGADQPGGRRERRDRSQRLPEERSPGTPAGQRPGNPKRDPRCCNGEHEGAEQREALHPLHRAVGDGEEQRHDQQRCEGQGRPDGLKAERALDQRDARHIDHANDGGDRHDVADRMTDQVANAFVVSLGLEHRHSLRHDGLRGSGGHRGDDRESDECREVAELRGRQQVAEDDVRRVVGSAPHEREEHHDGCRPAQPRSGPQVAQGTGPGWDAARLRDRARIGHPRGPLFWLIHIYSHVLQGLDELATKRPTSRAPHLEDINVSAAKKSRTIRSVSRVSRAGADRVPRPP